MIFGQMRNIYRGWEFEKKINLQILISFGAFIVAAVAFWWSFQSKVDSSKALENSEREVLVVRSERVNNNYETKLIHSQGFKGPPRVGFTALWDVRISNLGQRDVSLVEYSVEPVEHTPGYTPFDQGLFDQSRNALYLPFVIPAGQSEGLFVSSVILTSYFLSNALFGDENFKRTFSDSLGTHFDIEKLFNYLYYQGKDPFGNTVITDQAGQRYFGLRVDDIQDQQFIFQIKTSRGMTLVDTLAWYNRSRLPWPQK